MIKAREQEFILEFINVLADFIRDIVKEELVKRDCNEDWTSYFERYMDDGK